MNIDLFFAFSTTLMARHMSSDLKLLRCEIQGPILDCLYFEGKTDYEYCFPHDIHAVDC